MKNYKRFLTNLKKYYVIKPLKFHDRNKGSKSLCLLRHDIDSDLDKAVRMARIENKMGISSTYYALHTAPYYHKRRKDCIRKLKTIQSLGHEVGLHNDILTVCLRGNSKIKPVQLFEKELKFLDQHGINVYGIASHGSQLCIEHGISNTDIFKEFHKLGKQKTVKNIELFTINLKQHDMYEAYLLYKDYYFTDTGGEWNHGRLGGIGIDAYLRGISMGGSITIQILAHPGSWDI